MNRLIHLIDHQITYQISAFIFYVNYLFLSFFIDSEIDPLFPNPIILLYTLFVSFTLIIMSNELQLTNNPTKYYLIMMILGLGPPFIGTYLIYKWANQQRKLKNDFFFYISIYFLGTIFLLLGIFYLIVLILIGIENSWVVFLYFILTTEIGLCGILFGQFYAKDKNISYQEVTSNETIIEQVSYTFRKFIASLVSSPYRRFVMLILAYLGLIVLNIVKTPLLLPIET